MDDQHTNPVVGIDVSKRKCDAALLLAGKLEHKTIANTPAGFEQLVDWLASRHVDSGHVCLESTNIYGEALGTYLHERGFVVSIVNPARIKGFAQSELIRTKTDKADAGLIARFCAAMKPAASRPDPLEIQALRALVPVRSCWLHWMSILPFLMAASTRRGVRSATTSTIILA